MIALNRRLKPIHKTPGKKHGGFGARRVEAPTQHSSTVRFGQKSVRMVSEMTPKKHWRQMADTDFCYQDLEVYPRQDICHKTTACDFVVVFLFGG